MNDDPKSTPGFAENAPFSFYTGKPPEPERSDEEKRRLLIPSTPPGAHCLPAISRRITHPNNEQYQLRCCHQSHGFSKEWPAGKLDHPQIKAAIQSAWNIHCLNEMEKLRLARAMANQPANLAHSPHAAFLRNMANSAGLAPRHIAALQAAYGEPGLYPGTDGTGGTGVSDPRAMANQATADALAAKYPGLLDRASTTAQTALAALQAARTYANYDPPQQLRGPGAPAGISAPEGSIYTVTNSNPQRHYEMRGALWHLLPLTEVLQPNQVSPLAFLNYQSAQNAQNQARPTPAPKKPDPAPPPPPKFSWKRPLD